MHPSFLFITERGIRMYKIGFDNDKYLSMQSERIKERIAEFGGKLYLEFGGKLFTRQQTSNASSTKGQG